MKKLALSTITALSLASSAAFVQPALAKTGMGNNSGAANVFVACAVSSGSTPLSFLFLQASSGLNIKTPSTGSSCADAVAAVEALGLHVVAEETVVIPATGSATAPTTTLLIHLDNTNPGGNTSGNTNTGGNNWNNHGSNTGGNSGMQ